MGGWCRRALPPPGSQGGVLERLVVAPGCGLLVGGQGLFHVPQGPHADVIGVDDFGDAGARAERDPVGDTHRAPRQVSLPSLLRVSPRLRTVPSGLQGPSGCPPLPPVGAGDSPTHPFVHPFTHSFIHTAQQCLQAQGAGPRPGRGNTAVAVREAAQSLLPRSSGLVVETNQTRSGTGTPAFPRC